MGVHELSEEHLPEELLKNTDYSSQNYEKALKETFFSIDRLLDSEAGRTEIASLGRKKSVGSPDSASSAEKRSPSLFGDEGPDGKGCTANVVLIKNRTLYVANAGDSRAVLGVQGKATDLSIDHKPELESEKARVAKAGGTITNGRIEGNLNLSRTLGDLRYKKKKTRKPEEQIISAEPDVRKFPLTAECDFVIMGCDGIFETKSSQDIVTFYYEQLKAVPSVPLQSITEKLMDAIVSPDFLQTEGMGCDNMTCIVIQFKKPPSAS